MSLRILLHSSKTMRMGSSKTPLRRPALLEQAVELVAYLRQLNERQLMSAMHISAPLAVKTKQLLADWTTDVSQQTVALDSFIGDIYSGLQVSSFTTADRDYADEHLRILSGLYGIIRPLDGIYPYRLEMGYKLPDTPFKDLYEFWGQRIAATLPAEGFIVNVSSVEFSKTVTSFVAEDRVITPQFLTVDEKTGQPTFKVMHAKIARGAFAHWLIKQRVTEPQDFRHFDELGYSFTPKESRLHEPVFVCQEFGGKGLSMRLVK
jgi:cytoplasmic iron level regulating protein YaaA (DUF328/UPF0246 family)